LYVTVLRVTSREGLNILITDEDGEDINVTSNVVYEEISLFINFVRSTAT